jgi:MarR family transcriptional regulator, organic hydroperoxide resistance regulator
MPAIKRFRQIRERGGDGRREPCGFYRHSPSGQSRCLGIVDEEWWRTGTRRPLFHAFPLDNDRYNDYRTAMSSRPRTLRPPAQLEAYVFIALQKLADSLAQETEQLLKAHSLTGAQYNVLRILRGAEPDGLACSNISDRMISHDPDMTRLLDRMEKRALITRQRQKDDRRVVKTRITPPGLDLLKGLDQPIRELHKRQFRHIAPAQLKVFADLLDQALVREAEMKAS